MQLVRPTHLRRGTRLPLGRTEPHSLDTSHPSGLQLCNGMRTVPHHLTGPPPGSVYPQQSEKKPYVVGACAECPPPTTQLALLGWRLLLPQPTALATAIDDDYVIHPSLLSIS
jgi:hypothetical protein